MGITSISDYEFSEIINYISITSNYQAGLTFEIGRGQIGHLKDFDKKHRKSRPDVPVARTKRS